MLALAAHTDLLQKVAAVLQLIPTAWNTDSRQPAEQQVAACREWAERVTAAAATAEAAARLAGNKRKAP
jgi:hypothetical protein